MRPILFFAGFMAAIVGSASVYAGDSDPYLYLEQRDNPRALEWVKAHNARTVPKLTNDPRFAKVEAETRAVVMAPDRIPDPEAVRDGWVYNLWQDASHLRGLWRRCSLAEYGKATPNWEVLLDLDALDAKEKKSWVFKGAVCERVHPQRCLVSLSDGGGDAVTVREFDLTEKSFVKGGFEIPSGKSEFAWLDQNHLLIAPDLGPDSVTSSGYPRTVRIWDRGTALEKAPVIFEGTRDDVEVSPQVWSRRPYAFVVKQTSFFTAQVYRVNLPSRRTERYGIPEDVDFKGVFRGQAIFLLRKPWKGNPEGAVVSVSVNDVKDPTPRLVLAPDSKMTIWDVEVTKGYVAVSALENVRGIVLKLKWNRVLGRWSSSRLPFPDNGTLGIRASNPEESIWIASYQSFLQPRSIYAVDGRGKVKPLRESAARFESAPYEVEQFESTSKDGTKIPYFVIHRKNVALDGNNPTLLYGYGGFEISMSPWYLGTAGKIWLSRGGVYAVANIRGGGEFGPQWHQAAILKNRQRSFDDFISVAEDLIARKITRPARLGIQGGSNGGLLVGATFVERPDLFNAVVCEVPLLDMMRYHLLPPGASWMGEYGNPDDPEMGPYIRAYSPYQNLSKEKSYPDVFFLTSTKDDRVNPGHARKMAARMEEYGKPFEYFENTEGGHAGAADLQQRVRMSAFEYMYLIQRLMN